MSLDQASIDQLRARRALVGSSNLDEWARLVAKHGMDAVCWAIGKAAAKLGRRPTWKQVEEELPTSPVMVADIVREKAPTNAELVARYVPAAPVIIAKPPPPAEPEPEPDDEQPHDQVVEDDTTTQDEETTVPKNAPTAKKTDYRALAQKLGRFRLTELANAAGVAPQSAAHAIKSMLAERVIERDGKERTSPYVWKAGSAARSAQEPEAAPARAGGSTSSAKAPKGAPERAVTPPAARRSPKPRPTDHVGFGRSDLALGDGFEVLLARLIDAYAEHHDLGPRPSARRALIEAAQAVFPKE